MRDNFNSIKVRLEPFTACGFALKRLFQFHKGTIRTGWLLVTLFIYCDFNSIKVRLEQPGCKCFFSCEINFNSIKVRLEHTWEAVGCVPHLDFNSIKVRLEHIGKYGDHKFNLFQFHKGTIRTDPYRLSAFYSHAISIP